MKFKWLHIWGLALGLAMALAPACTRRSNDYTGADQGAVLDSLAATVDSASQSYMWHLLNRRQSITPLSTLQEVKRQLDNLDRFTEEGDPLMTAVAYSALATLAYDNNDMANARNFADNSYKILSSLGMPDAALICNPRLPMMMADDGHRRDAVTANERLIHLLDSLPGDRGLGSALRNHYLLTGRIEYLLKASALPEYDSRENACNLALIAECLDIEGREDSAAIFTARAMAAQPDELLRVRAATNRALAAVLVHNASNAGAAKAYTLMETAAHQDDSMRRIRQSYAPVIAAYRTDHLVRDYTEGYARRETIMRVALCVLGALLVGAAVWIAILMYQRRKSVKNNSIPVEYMARSLAMKQNSAAHSRVLRQIDRMKSEKKLSGEASKQLIDALTGDGVGGDQWKDFMENYEQINPRFVANMRRQHPALADNYHRLALLVHLGLSNSEIATLLKVKPESVHQSRWRLRRKLGVEDGTSLEQWLCLYD